MLENRIRQYSLAVIWEGTTDLVQRDQVLKFLENRYVPILEEGGGGALFSH